MQFKPRHAPTLFQGRLEEGHPLGNGRSVIVDLAGCAFLPADVDVVVPDDEEQGKTIRAAGYKIATPLSMTLGPGASGSEA